MQGAHVARNADANVIRGDIFVLSHNDAKKHGWLMPAVIGKADRGIKSECTARFLLPFTHQKMRQTLISRLFDLMSIICHYMIQVQNLNGRGLGKIRSNKRNK